MGEAPGEVEDQRGVPFVGPAGELLDEFIALAGLVRDECWITNIVKYRPTDAAGNNRRPNFIECVAGSRYTRRELVVVNPRLVVLCGRTAYQAVKPGASVVRDRGGIFVTDRWPDRRYMPVLHPSACLQGPGEWLDRTRADWRRIPSLL